MNKYRVRYGYSSNDFVDFDQFLDALDFITEIESDDPAKVVSCFEIISNDVNLRIETVNFHFAIGRLLYRTGHKGKYSKDEVKVC